MVRLFKRKHNLDENTQLPQEVREYYASTKKRRLGMAFLLGFMSLMVVLAFSFGIYTFFNSIFSKYDEVGQQTEEVITQPQEKPDSNVDSVESNEVVQPEQVEQPAQIEQPKQATAKPKGSQNVPDTGPGQTLALFIATVGVGILISQVYQRRTISE